MINSLYDIYFGKNDSEDSFAHVGRSKRDGAKVGSGRYPLGSGKEPYQHDNKNNKKEKKYYYSNVHIPVVGITKGKAKKVLPEETYKLWEKIIDSHNDLGNGIVYSTQSYIDKYSPDGKHKRTEIVLTRPAFEEVTWSFRDNNKYTKQEQKIIDTINNDPNFNIVGMTAQGKHERLGGITAYNGKDQIFDIRWVTEAPNY